MSDEVLKRRTRIMVVDDEPLALRVIPGELRDGLEELGWSDLVIDTAASGEEAVEVGRSGDLHLLVTDVVMPGIDGIETFARLKERHPTMVCVVMTAQAPQHVTPIRALRLGAADYVTKPVDPDYLIQTCHRQLMVLHLGELVDTARQLLEAVLGSIDSGVIALRGDEVLLENAAAGKMLGGEGDLVARLAEHGLDQARPSASDRSTREVDARVEGADGIGRSLSVIGSPVVGQLGARLGDVLVLRDVTHVANRKAMESFKRMAAIAAHEMKNSVTGLQLVTEHLVARLEQGKLEPAEAHRMAAILLDAVARLDRFARSFLGFSRIPDPRPMPTDPNDLVRDALELYSQQNGLPDWVRVERDLPEGLPLVNADRDLMFQVLQNLVLNAVEAMEAAGEGTVTLRSALEETADGLRVRITVQDTGVGIAEDMVDRIFEPNVTTREAGTGLGLVVVSDIVAKHDGRVRVRSTRGEGAAFDVLLPVADS